MSVWKSWKSWFVRPVSGYVVIGLEDIWSTILHRVWVSLLENYIAVRPFLIHS